MRGVIVYWDQMCMNYGTNWELSSISAIKNNDVIALLISEQVLLFFILSF